MNRQKSMQLAFSDTVCAVYGYYLEITVCVVSISEAYLSSMENNVLFGV